MTSKNAASAQRWLDIAAENLATLGEDGLQPGEYVQAAATIGFGYSQLAHLDRQHAWRTEDLARHADERAADLERIADADAKAWAHQEHIEVTNDVVAEAHAAMAARLRAEQEEIEVRTAKLAELDAATLAAAGQREERAVAEARPHDAAHPFPYISEMAEARPRDDEHADDCTGCDGPGIVPCAADEVRGGFAMRDGKPIKDLRGGDRG